MFLGISIACRFEFIFCYVPLMYYIIKSQISINCKQMIKLLCLNLLIFITPLFSTWSVLFMQGFSVNDLVFYINFIKNFVSAPETVVYTINAGCSFLSLFYGIKLIIKFTIIFVLLSLFNIFSIKNILSKNNTFLFLVSILLLLICILVDIKVFTKYFYIIFCPICLTTIWIIIVSFRKDKDSQCSALRLLCLFCLLSCIRTSFVFISGYYLYFIILPFIANFIYLIKEEHLATIQKSIVIYIILLCSIMFCYSFFVVKDYEKVYFPPQKSVIFKQSKLRTSVYNKAIKWIEINTNKNDRILVLPEGPMLNFITNRPTNYKYFHLVPSHITTVGEKNIVNDLKKDPPEYIFIQSLEYLIYGKNYFGIDFGKDIFIYIINNYNLVTQIKSENSDTEFFITIFKLKTKH